MEDIKVSKFEMVLSFSEAFELISHEIMDHHYTVAYIVMEILEKIDMSFDEKIEIMIAALIHDIGAFKLKEDIKLSEFEFSENDNHAKNGYYLLLNYPPFYKIGTIIKYHHDNWDKNKDDEGIHIGSNIINIAEKFDLFLDKNQKYYEQKKEMKNFLEREKDKMFMPKLVEIVLDLCENDNFWLNVIFGEKEELMFDRYKPYLTKEDLKNIIGLGKLFAHIIDFRNRFTAVHSSGVAFITKEICKLLEYSEEKQDFMLLAGYLHDIGKLAIPNKILDKNGRLTKSEIGIIRSHPFHSYRILKKVASFDELAKIASYHHERLDGKGYPFGLNEKQLSEEARIVAVADIFTALSEKRPYRDAMPKEKIVKILSNLVGEGHLDGNIVNTLINNLEMLMEKNLAVQKEITEQYLALDEIVFNHN